MDGNKSKDDNCSRDYILCLQKYVVEGQVGSEPADIVHTANDSFIGFVVPGLSERDERKLSFRLPRKLTFEGIFQRKYFLFVIEITAKVTALVIIVEAACGE